MSEPLPPEAVEPPGPPPTIKELVLGNAYALSEFYLYVALFLELMRRIKPRPFFEATMRRLDDLPGTVLHVLGVMPLLRRAFVYEGLGTWVVRLVFGLTTVAIIYALAAATGAGLGLLRWGIRRARGQR